MKDFSSFGAALNFSRLHTICGPVRNLHPGTKLLTIVAGIGVISFASSWSSLLLLLVFFLAAAAAAKIGPFRILQPVLPVLPFILLVLLIHALTLPRPEGDPLLSCTDIPAVTLLFLRILAFMTLIGVISASMCTAEISYGLEALLLPLDKIGIPTGQAALIAMLTFRFIPILQEESIRLAKAQTARGGSLGFRSVNPLKRIYATLPLMIPLFISTLHRAETLAESIHLRGFREDRIRTRLRRHSINSGDWIWLASASTVFTMAVLMHIFKVDLRLNETVHIFLQFLSRRSI